MFSHMLMIPRQCDESITIVTITFSLLSLRYHTSLHTYIIALIAFIHHCIHTSFALIASSHYFIMNQIITLSRDIVSFRVIANRYFTSTLSLAIAIMLLLITSSAFLLFFVNVYFGARQISVPGFMSS